MKNIFEKIGMFFVIWFLLLFASSSIIFPPLFAIGLLLDGHPVWGMLTLFVFGPLFVLLIFWSTGQLNEK